MTSPLYCDPLIARRFPLGASYSQFSFYALRLLVFLLERQQPRMLRVVVHANQIGSGKVAEALLVVQAARLQLLFRLISSPAFLFFNFFFFCFFFFSFFSYLLLFMLFFLFFIFGGSFLFGMYFHAWNFIVEPINNELSLYRLFLPTRFLLIYDILYLLSHKTCILSTDWLRNFG